MTAADTEHTPLVRRAANSHAHTSEMPPMRVLMPVCAALWTMTFTASLDGTIAAMLLGSISASFNSSEQAAWIGSIYLLAVCCVSPLYGRLGDIIGRKRSFIAAEVLFLVGTIWCACARSMAEFLAARLVTGLGGGGLSTIASVILSHMIPLKNRGVFQGLTNIVFGLGTGTGAPLGGWINDAVGWRGAFYIQVPVLIIAVALTVACIDADEPDESGTPLHVRLARNVDFGGIALFITMLLSALYAIAHIGEGNWFADPWMALSTVLAVVALVAFYLWEARVASMPVMLVDILHERTGGSVCWNNFFLSFAAFAYSYQFPLFFQTVGGLSPAVIGTRMIPSSVLLSTGSVLAGVYMQRTGRYYHYTVTCAAAAVMSMVPTLFFGANPPLVMPFVYNMVLSFSQAGVLTCTLIALINCVSREHVGVSTGMSYLFRTTGQVLGVSLTGEIMQFTLSNALKKRVTGPDAQQIIDAVRHKSTIVHTLPEPLRTLVVESYAIALHYVFLIVILSYFFSFAAATLIRDVPLATNQTDKRIREAINEEGETHVENYTTTQRAS
ncbi:hypothetical protein MCUN1_002875 [Malassezia cuniculi]|uniref:Major facilitator superfamily (MFS) profile domain-containing protein n=1 Tax=Malassezia cuniculi TaxID=948313 RepID=A0AAF0EWU7_9BASI|nr:hypothetical protein MCUN1_002875 [Malassezia cuniculi]